MRHLITSVTVLVAACTSAPVGYRADEMTGHWRRQQGPELRDELELVPDGRCTWRSFRYAGYRHEEATTGRWTVEQDGLVIELDSGVSSRMTLRRWQGHVYLVPPRHLEWFDGNGPDEEWCFHVDGAPLVGQPPYFLTDAPADGNRSGTTTGTEPRQ